MKILTTEYEEALRREWEIGTEIINMDGQDIQENKESGSLSSFACSAKGSEGERRFACFLGLFFERNVFSNRVWRWKVVNFSRRSLQNLEFVGHNPTEVLET